MKVTLPSRAPGEEGALVVLEVEFTSKARRVHVEASDGLETLDLDGQGPGGRYELAPSLPRVHVPLRVTRAGPGVGRVAVVVEDAAQGLPPERWIGTIDLDLPEVAWSRGRLAALLGAFAALAAALVGFVILPALRDPTVPSLEGRSRAQAESALKSQGFAPATESVPARTKQDEGLVLGQVPASGSRLPRGSTVLLTVGRAPEEAKPRVPALVGRTIGQAEALVAGTAWTLTSTFEDAADELEGRVLRQEPAAGARRASGAIEVVVGRRRPPATGPLPPVVLPSPESPTPTPAPVPETFVDLPELVGRSRSEAEAVLAAAGLLARVTERDAEEGDVGFVLEQAVPAGRVIAGSEVAFVVGRLRPLAPVAEIPYVVGSTRVEAAKALAEAGFLPEWIDAVEGGAAPGTVVAQEPAGAVARRGETVILRVVPGGEPLPVARVEPPAVPATPEPVPEPVVPEPVVPEPVVPEPVVPEPVTPEPVLPEPVVPEPVVPEPVAPESVTPEPVAPEPVVPQPVVPQPVAPDLLGLDRARAEVALASAGFEARVSFADVDPGAPEGVVLAQTPLAGEAVATGVVEVVLARRATPQGPVVPDVTGRLEAEASATLRAASFLVHVMREGTSPANVGRVLRQLPAAGSVEAARAWVTLVVGREGPPPEPVASRAPPAPPSPTAVLPAPAPTPTAAPTAAPPPVVRTAPKEWAPPPPVDVRPGPERFAIASLEGRETGEAIQLLLQAGYLPLVSLDPEALTPGRVRRQEPAAGTTLRTGDTVRLVVGALQGRVADLPLVVGLSAADATARLAQAGFTAEVVRLPSRPGVFGRPEQVLGQSPVGRGPVPGPVRLFLAR